MAGREELMQEPTKRGPTEYHAKWVLQGPFSNDTK
jgi:hypothetical protein